MPPYLNDHTEQVGDVQRKLAMLGLYHAQRTESLEQLRPALEAFQHKYRHQFPALPDNGDCDFATWQALNHTAGSLFSEVLQFEQDNLFETHVRTPVRPAIKSEVIQRAHRNRLTGLAFSGGGIRSATFNLGILQALSQLGLLQHFDYLSSVSGGGYIGAWLSKWIMESNGDVSRVEQELTPGSHDNPRKHEPNEIRFLRQNSNYLNPRAGLFSADSWTLIANYIRNTTLNMCLLIALLAAVLSLPGLLTWFVHHYQDHQGWFGVAVASLGFAVFFCAFSISLQPNRQNRHNEQHQTSPHNQHNPHWLTSQSQATVICLVILPLMLAGLCGSVAIWQWRCDWAHVCNPVDMTLHNLFDPSPPQYALPGNAASHGHFPNLLLPGGCFFVAWLLGWAAAQLANITHPAHSTHPAHLANPADPEHEMRWQAVLQEGLGHLLCAIAALAIGTVLTVFALRWFAHREAVGSLGAPSVHLVTLGMPMLLLIAGLTMILLIGLLGRLYSDRSREWWSREGGWTSILLIVWLGLFGIGLYAPPLLAWVHQRSAGWGDALIASGWIGTTIAGLIAGRKSGAGSADADPKLRLLAATAPYVFSIGILAAIASLVHFAANPAHLAAMAAAPNHSLGDFLQEYLAYREKTALQPQLMLLAICLGIGFLLAWRLDINKFSLYMIMRNRLVRTFLGASNRKRSPHPFTGFDPKDDPALAKLHHPHTGQPQRPYPLINTTLNLVGGKDLAWQTKKAAGFVFSPGFCGFELARSPATHANETGYDAQRGCFRPTQTYGGRGKFGADEDKGTRLGMATAISGAAISTTLAQNHSAPLNFLMTLFNMRLGRWCGNPLRQTWKNSGPQLGLFCLISELLGLTDARANYVHLSDGGHFENLGIYELVRRRCHLIVVVDASTDGQLDFADLGNAIRRCQIDLGIEIDIDVANIDLKNGFSNQQCVAGKIYYGKTDPNAPDGTLLYIKPALTGKEPAGVLNHRKSDPGFPHQTRFAYWFDETQFESYRALGYQIGCAALEQATKQAKHPDYCDTNALCEEILTQWQQPLRSPPTPPTPPT